MTHMLTTLNADLELTKAEYSVRYDLMMEELSKIISRCITDRSDAVCTRKWFRSSMNPGHLEICMEFGFHNSEENRIDFGSDIWTEFSTETGELKLNYGTCGIYSKQDIYQVKRIQLISYIWANIEHIEQELSKFSSTVTPVVVEFQNKKYALEKEIRDIEDKIKSEDLKQIENKLVEGVSLAYADNCSIKHFNRLFYETCRVIKITPKFVTVINSHNVESKIRKEQIVSNIYYKHIVMIEEKT